MDPDLENLRTGNQCEVTKKSCKDCGVSFSGSRRHTCFVCFTKKHKKKKARDRQSKKQRNRNYINDIKSNPCTDCKKTYNSYVMQFDHIDSETKEQNVSRMVTSCSIPVIAAEIAKCELVCANCHAERTHQRSLLKKIDHADTMNIDEEEE